MPRAIRALILILTLVLAATDETIAAEENTQSAAEAVALAQSAFTAPIRLSTSRDGASELPSIEALKAQFNQPSGGFSQSVVSQFNSHACILDNQDQLLQPQYDMFIAKLIGVNSSDPRSTMKWVFGNGLAQIKTVNIKNSVIYCPLINMEVINKIRQAMPDAIIRASHEATEIRIAKRVFVEWTYRNIYTTLLPQKGDAKVFAGTFSYKIEPVVPSILKLDANGTGTWRFKMYYDPDQGRWTILESENNEPAINLISTGPPTIIRSDAAPTNPEPTPAPKGGQREEEKHPRASAQDSGEVVGSAVAQAPSNRQPQIGPSFDCQKTKAPLARIICADPALSALDLRFNQTYWALLKQVGDAGTKLLKAEDVEFIQGVENRCGIMSAGTADTPEARACVKTSYEAQRQFWMSRLSGPALEEARRPAERHLVLQRDLQLLGFLPVETAIDGVYGAATRTAISTWQVSQGRHATGFLGDADAIALEREASGAPGEPPVAAVQAPPPTQQPAQLSPGEGLTVTVTPSRTDAALIIKGEIRNETKTGRDVPKLRVAIRDASESELATKVITPPIDHLKAGATAIFETTFDPNDQATGVAVAFVTDAPKNELPQPSVTGPGTSPTGAAETTTPTDKVAAAPEIDSEMLFWQSIFTSSNPADFEEYLRQYPQGRFAGLARNRLAEFRAKARPAPQAKQAALAPAAPTPAAKASPVQVQLASLRSPEAAREDWVRLKRENPDLWGRLTAVAVRTDLGDKGIYYRILAGPFGDAAAAERLCDELKKRGVGCSIIP